VSGTLLCNTVRLEPFDSGHPERFDTSLSTGLSKDDLPSGQACRRAKHLAFVVRQAHHERLSRHLWDTALGALRPPICFHYLNPASGLARWMAPSNFSNASICRLAKPSSADGDAEGEATAASDARDKNAGVHAEAAATDGV
jgi:hypothetical protein